MVKRIKVEIEGESEARQEGLSRAIMARDGFACLGCGAQQSSSPYIMANWGSLLVHTCQTCGATHKMKAGVITLLSGPTKRLKRIKEIAEREPEADPRKPQWRAYLMMHNAGRPPLYRAVTNYHDSLDACNTQAFDYATNAEPHSRTKRDELFDRLIRREEFPLLSQVETNGILTGFGDVLAAGFTLVGSEYVHHFELRDPKGNKTIIALRPADYAKLVDTWELSVRRNPPGPLNTCGTNCEECIKANKCLGREQP